MKKNDFATIIAYVLMLGVAILMGLLVIKPVLDEFGNAINGSIHYIVLVILSLMAGVVLNALLLEFGHLLGALSLGDKPCPLDIRPGIQRGREFHGIVLRHILFHEH